MKQTVEIRTVHGIQGNITYELARKSVKNINLRVKSSGKVLVSANAKVPVSYIDDFIKEKADFILHAQKRFAKRREQDIPEKNYNPGESFFLLGKQMQLQIVEGSPESVKLTDCFVILTVKDSQDFKRKEKLFQSWLKEFTSHTFLYICHDVYDAFTLYYDVFPDIKIRRMTARWGTCYPTKGRIILNSRLIAFPKSCIEYVVLHEFAHFIYPNHSRQFYALIESLMPDWKERQKRLALE